MKKDYTIAVAGTGYVGLSIATLLSQHHKVMAVDIVKEKVDLINNRKSPIQDDYGKEAFVKLHDFLVGYMPEKANQFCMAGFILKNTLSENGAVTRGICETNEEGYLTAVHETSNIVKIPEGAAVDNDGQLTSINAESYASMNMWGLTPEFMQTLEDGFKEFFANMGDKDILKAEYLLIIPGLFEPPVRTLRATIPENESHIFR